MYIIKIVRDFTYLFNYKWELIAENTEMLKLNSIENEKKIKSIE